MVINICDVPEKYKNEVLKDGGTITRNYGGLLDVCFQNHKLTVRDNYVVVRACAGHKLVFADNEFSNIYIH